MGDTSIEWTDKTWNPVRGCTKVSPGCKHCYAETFAERWRGIPGHPFEQGFDLRLVPEKLGEPLKWKKPQRIFVNSMSDLFHEDVPESFIRAVYATMAETPRHTFQVLTKRAGRRREILARWQRDGLTLREGHGSVLPNVWEGVSVESPQYEHRMTDLIDTPARVRFVSLEPLLSSVNMRPWLAPGISGGPMIDWVIVGGESGPGARPFDVAWARRVVDDCHAAGAPVFVKQLGAQPEYRRPLCTASGTEFVSRDLVHLRSRKGGAPSEWPEDLRVREWPEVAL